MNPFIADWYAKEHQEDLLREAQRERLVAAARNPKPRAPRQLRDRLPRPAGWIRAHLGHAAA